jgi:3-dehydroquinate synthase
MKRIRLEIEGPTDRSYDVVVGRGILTDLYQEIQSLGSFSSYALVTDEHVGPLVADTLLANLESHDLRTTSFTFPGGESAKTMRTVLDLCHDLVAHGCDRKSLLLAVGGGVVGDIAGFAAAIYLRGIPYIQIPTTLLAQVDSAIGGKTGVDFSSGKNLLGAFHQPLLVLSDPEVLVTLPPTAMREGLAEVIKTALIGKTELFSILEGEESKLLETDNPLLEKIIAETSEIKCRLVGQDEHEAGLRRILNFGHTLGHAVESASNYSVGHGQAVAAGMGIAIRLSQLWAGLTKDEADRALTLIQKLGLPTELPGDIHSESLLAALEKDKKIQGGVCHFVLLSKIGQPNVHPIPVEELHRSIKQVANWGI